MTNKVKKFKPKKTELLTDLEYERITQISPEDIEKAVATSNNLLKRFINAEIQ